MSSERSQPMEYPRELKRHLGDKKLVGASAKITLPSSGQRIDLQDKFKQEKPNLSYADLHPEITRNAKDVSPKSSGDHQKQRIGRKGNKEDELVKYMSKLPNYLEKGRKPQEKLLNVGVLDWGRLEKWQHKQMPHSGGRSSLSNSSLSSSFSTDASASGSSRGYTSSPPRHRTQRPSLQFHLMSSSVEARPQVVKSFKQNVEKFQYHQEARTTLNNWCNFIGTEKLFGKANQEPKPEEFKGKDSDPKIGRESRTLPNRMKCEIGTTAEVKFKTQDGQYVKRVERQQEGNIDVANGDVPGKQETAVRLVPTDVPQSNIFRATNFSNLTMTLDQEPAENRRRSFLQRSKAPNLPCDFDKNNHLQMKQTGFINPKINNSSKRSQSVSRSAKIGNFPSGGGSLEDKNSTATINKLTNSEPLMGLDPKASKGATEKVRSTTPFRRLSFSMGKISKNSSSKEASALPQLNTTYISAQSASDLTDASHGLDASSRGNTTSRARSSPLRRLLDPILKSRPTNCHNISKPLPRDSIKRDGASKSSDGRQYSSDVAAQSGKVKLDMTTCRLVNVNDSFHEKKQGSQVQALLRAAVKNGQPLFTFAVDEESEILAATLKNLSTSRNEDYSSLYTFFTIQEVKKKNGRWLNQGGKGQIHDYIPNVVAQMKVDGCSSSNLIKQNYVNHFSMREFVLSSVGFRQADEKTSYLQPNNELAAIVVKIPIRISRSSLADGFRSDMLKDHPEVGLKDYLQEAIYESNPGTNIQNCSSTISQDIGATVILPSGVHALPNKGEPSSLIQRWRSGGSCDCGGWDLGCKLRILANGNQPVRNAGSSKTCSATNQFELFYQGGVQDNQPFFSLAPFKEDIYSVEFNSSVTLLQAFSMCIAVLDSRKPYELSESCNLFEEKGFAESISVQNGGKRAPERTEGEIPPRYVSYPPLSPVGRV